MPPQGPTRRAGTTAGVRYCRKSAAPTHQHRRTRSAHSVSRRATSPRLSSVPKPWPGTHARCPFRAARV